MSFLSSLFCSNVRAEIFQILFEENIGEIHLREICRLSNTAINGVRRDIRKLEKMELVLSRRDGNRLYYQANKNHPLYPEIKNIILKTSGIFEILKKTLTHSAIECVFIFGSIAKGTEKSQSDIDLMVIGSIGLRKLSDLLFNVSTKTGREINPHTLTQKEFCKRLEKGDHFLTSVLESPKIFIIGTENGLKTMGG